MARSRIVFYISGHGFGHASRQIEILNALWQRAPSLDLIVRTSASRWFFDLTLRVPATVSQVECDPGVVQRGSLEPDEAESMRRAAAFYDLFGEHVRREADYLHESGAEMVVGDIPPLAFAAASAAGLDSVAISNFTWDWIYEAYAHHLPASSAVIRMIREAYSAARLTLRLPMAGGFEAMDPATIVDIPLVGRRSSREPAAVRHLLGLPWDRRLALLSFGGYGLDTLAPFGLRLPGWAIVTTTQVGASLGKPTAVTPIIVLDEQEFYRAGLRYEDLVAACDVVISKPGYGIVAECAANGTALLYTSRGNFPEYDVLVAAMPALVRSLFIPQDDLFAGRWGPYLDALMAQASPARPRADGAEVAAEHLLRRLPGAST